MNELMNIPELAKSWKVQQRYIRNRCSALYCQRHGLKMIPHIRIGNRLRFDPQAIAEYLKSMEYYPSKNSKKV